MLLRLRVVARRERRRGWRYQSRLQLDQIGVASLAALCLVLLLDVLTNLFMPRQNLLATA